MIKLNITQYNVKRVYFVKFSPIGTPMFHIEYSDNTFTRTFIETFEGIRQVIKDNPNWNSQDNYKWIKGKYIINKTKMSAKRYVLIDNKSPKIEGKIIIEDLNVGGIKLTYEVSNNKSTLSQRDIQTHIYLRPYKTNLGEDKKDCEETFGKGSWGNTSSPLSNVWFKIKKDYTDYNKEFMFIRYDRVIDTQLISELNKKTKKFVLGSDEPIRDIPLKEKVLITIENIKEQVKSRIFLR
jgi:hypothetical protein